MKRKLFTLLLVFAFAALLTTAALAYDDPNTGTLAELPLGLVLNTNAGGATVAINNGTIRNNMGTVAVNRGIVDINNGTVYKNTGMVASNYADVHNYGGMVPSNFAMKVEFRKVSYVLDGTATTLTAAGVSEVGDLNYLSPDYWLLDHHCALSLEGASKSITISAPAGRRFTGVSTTNGTATLAADKLSLTIAGVTENVRVTATSELIYHLVVTDADGAPAVLGTDYGYDTQNGVLTILSGHALTVSMAPGVTTTPHRIAVNAVAGGAKLTLNAVTISTTTGSALELRGDTALTLSGANRLYVDGSDGISLDGAALTVNGNGTLDLAGTYGIWTEGGSATSLTITSGEVTVTGSISRGVMVDTLTLEGGSLTAAGVTFGIDSAVIRITGGTLTATGVRALPYQTDLSGYTAPHKIDYRDGGSNYTIPAGDARGYSARLMTVTGLECDYVHIAPAPIEAGDFVLTGASLVTGTDYSFNSGVLTILSGKAMTVSMKSGVATTSNHITVNPVTGGATLTLSGVTIDGLGDSSLTVNGDTTLTLSGANTLNYNTNAVTLGSAALTINGSGSLRAEGLNGFFTTSAAWLTIESGDVMAAGDIAGTGVFGIDVTVNGGSLTASGGFGLRGGTLTVTGGTVTASGSFAALGLSGVAAAGMRVYAGDAAATDTLITDLAGTETVLPRDVKYVHVEPGTRLATPTGLAWDADVPAKATWDAVTNAAGYSVQLYKDGVKLGAAASAATVYYDFTANTAANGSYTFTVTALSPGAIGGDVVFHSLASAESAAYVKHTHDWDETDAAIQFCTDCKTLRVKTEGAELWIDGIPLDEDAIDEDAGGWLGFEHALGAGVHALTTYAYHDGAPSQAHTNYPSGMRVWLVSVDAAGSVTDAETRADLTDLLAYAGTSIRLSGEPGIRMITQMDTAKRAALLRGTGGWTLVETGTVAAWAATNTTPTLGAAGCASNFAYKQGAGDAIFKRTGGALQYTNVLVGYTDPQCLQDFAMRPYATLQNNATGELVTVYGGVTVRSIQYVAQQNAGRYSGDAGAYIDRIIALR